MLSLHYLVALQLKNGLKLIVECQTYNCSLTFCKKRCLYAAELGLLMNVVLVLLLDPVKNIIHICQ